jgi:hypothetical protein
MTLQCPAAEPLAGRWEGSVQIPGNDLVLVIDLSPDNHGSWIGSITIPGLGSKGVSLKDIVVKESEATFSMASAASRGPDATFKAHLNGNGMLAGDFVQGGNTAPFELKQIGPPQVELPRRSTVVSKELEGEWLGEFQLFGYARKVSLKLTNNGGHAAAAEFVVVGKRVNNLPVDLVTQEGSLLSIHSHQTGISFEGRFRNAGGEIRGTFAQGPIEVPLVLHRK